MLKMQSVKVSKEGLKYKMWVYRKKKGGKCWMTTCTHIDSWKDSPTAGFPPLWRKYPLARLRKKSGDLGLYEVSHQLDIDQLLNIFTFTFIFLQ